MTMKTTKEVRLQMDIDTGEANIDVSFLFNSRSALFRMDVLQDWISELNTEYQAAVRQFVKEQSRDKTNQNN